MKQKLLCIIFLRCLVLLCGLITQSTQGMIKNVRKLKNFPILKNKKYFSSIPTINVRPEQIYPTIKIEKPKIVPTTITIPPTITMQKAPDKNIWEKKEIEFYDPYASDSGKKVQEAEYTKIPAPKKGPWAKYSKNTINNFGLFSAKVQNTQKKFNRKYSTQTHRSEEEMASFFRRELLIAKQEGGDEAVSTKYHQLAKQYHPDIRKDSGLAMTTLNNMKEEVDKISQKDINEYLNPQKRTSTRGSTQGNRGKNIYDYDINDIQDYKRWEEEYLQRKKKEEEEAIKSGTIIAEAPLNKEELKVRTNLLKYIDKFQKIRADVRKEILTSYSEDISAYDVKLADGTTMYINKYALDDDFIEGKYLVGYEEPSNGYARKIYRLQQQTLPKDFSDHILFKEKVYDRLVSGLAELYGRTRGNLLANDERFDALRMAQAESELEIENMIRDQLKDYEEYVKSCSYNGLNHIGSASIVYTPNENSMSKKLYEKKSGFIDGHFTAGNNYLAAIYDLYCNEYIVGNIHTYRVEPTPFPFLLLKCYFDALKNNSLPDNSPYSIKSLAHDILEKQKRNGYPVIKRSLWSKFSNLF